MFWDKAKRVQRYLKLCEDRVIEDIGLDIMKAYVEDKNRLESWHLLHDMLFPVAKSKDPVLLISERDSIPLSPYPTVSAAHLKDLTDIVPIAREELQHRLLRISKESQKNLIASAIRFSILIIAILFVVVVLISLFMSGKVHLPGTG